MYNLDLKLHVWGYNLSDFTVWLIRGTLRPGTGLPDLCDISPRLMGLQKPDILANFGAL